MTMISVLIRMFVMLIVIAVLIAIIVKTEILNVIMKSGKEKVKPKVDNEGYIEKYQQVFSKSGSIPDTFNKLIDMYPEKSVERKTLVKAAEYLENSVIKDYRSAFDIIEKVMIDDKIKEMHNASIVIVKENRKYLIATRKKRRRFG